jgi:hypothetical protein
MLLPLFHSQVLLIILLKAKPADGKAWYEPDWCYNEMSKYDEALTGLNTSVGLSDISAPNYYMDLYYIAKNQKTKAKDDISKTCKS